MRIKIDNEIVQLDDDSTVEDLKKLIGQDLKEIRAGFPPKPIDLSAKSTPLKQLGIENGDKLIIKRTEKEPETLALREPENTNIESSPFVTCGDGYLKLRIMEDDNSCLFRAVGYTMLGNTDAMFELRTIVADAIRKDPVQYSDAILGKPRSEYINWILQENSWGGAIEINILANHFEVTICSLDVSTLRVDHFNPGAQSFVVIVYSGIHYDAIALSPMIEDYEASELDQTVFQPDEQGLLVLDSLNNLGKRLKSQHYYTNTSDFEILCNTCKQRFKGEKQAIVHANKTGHSNFGET